MKQFITVVLVSFLVACGGKDEKPVVEEQPLQPMVKSKNSDTFNTSFQQLLDAYFSLKNQFIAEDVTAIHQYGNDLLQKTDSLKTNALKGDAGIIENANSFRDVISGELKAMVAEKDIMAQKKSFGMISEALYTLFRVVQYDRSILYQMSTDKAFENNTGSATWLSLTKDIQNPYKPKTLLTDGAIIDTLKTVQ